MKHWLISVALICLGAPASAAIDAIQGGIVGSGRLASDSASLLQVSGGAMSSDGTDITVTSGGKITLSGGGIVHVSLGDASNAGLIRAAGSGQNLILDGGSSGGDVVVRQGGGANTTATFDENGVRFNLPSAQTIAAGNTITADACGGLKQITAGGAVTTDTTNTFTAPAAANSNCCMDVVNTGTNAITLDANANFASAGAADVVLGADDSVRVCSNGASGKWRQIGGTGNN